METKYSKFRSLAKFIILFGVIFCLDAGYPDGASAESAPVLKARVLKARPHNRDHFTEGLFFHKGSLFESSGMYKLSLIAKKDPKTGATLVERKLAARYFAEGCTVVGNSIYLLTWHENTALILDAETLEQTGSFQYAGDGWGLAHDGEKLIRSDGTDTLYFHAPDGRELGKVKVRDGEVPVERINEMEWAPDERLLLAHIWKTPRIAAIDIESGQVRFWLESPQPAEEYVEKDRMIGARRVKAREMVPNGMALAPDGKSLWITGKCWPEIYQVAWPPELEKIAPR